MDLIIQPIFGLPDPPSTAWVDDVLSAVDDDAGALVSRAMSTSGDDGAPDGLITLWRDAGSASAGPAAPAVDAGGGVRLGAGRRYTVTGHFAGAATGPARYLQQASFDGPRTPRWTAAFDRAGAERIWPAVRDLPGIVATLAGRADDGATVMYLLAETVEALDAATGRVLSTSLLPGEDPALLTGPDRVEVHRLMHAVLPTAGP